MGARDGQLTERREKARASLAFFDLKINIFKWLFFFKR